MREELEKARAAFDNSGNRGDEGEEAVREVLRRFLPRRFDVAHGEVIDSYGGRSAQTDVVITNEDHPYTFTRDKRGLFLAEGVSAAGEVKAALTSEGLEDSIRKALAFKALRHMNLNMMGMVSGRDRNPFGANPPWFLFAFASQLSLETIGARLAERQARQPGEKMIDAVFCLDRGALVDVGDGTTDLKAMDAQGRPMTGWVTVATQDVLFECLGWLSISMPRVLRMDSVLGKYLSPSREA